MAPKKEITSFLLGTSTLSLENGISLSLSISEYSTKDSMLFAPWRKPCSLSISSLSACEQCVTLEENSDKKTDGLNSSSQLKGCRYRRSF